MSNGGRHADSQQGRRRWGRGLVCTADVCPWKRMVGGSLCPWRCGLWRSGQRLVSLPTACIVRVTLLSETADPASPLLLQPPMFGTSSGKLGGKTSLRRRFVFVSLIVDHIPAEKLYKTLTCSIKYPKFWKKKIYTRIFHTVCKKCYVTQRGVVV